MFQVFFCWKNKLFVKMVSEKFKVGDPVWAKMKSYPPWPARIEDPDISPNVKPPKNKKAHFVYFFGTKNYAWIVDENISPHNENVLSTFQNKKKSATLQDAFDEFIVYFKNKEKEKQSSPKMEKKTESNKDSPTKITNSVSKQHEVKNHKSRIKKAKRSFLDMNGENDICPPKSRKVSNNYDINNMHSLLNDYSWDDTSQEMYEKFLAGQKVNRKSVQPSQKKFGFIGLGRMGKAIVLNMLESGHDVTVWNNTMSKCISLEELGAKKANTPTELVIACDVIFCCVSDADACRKLIFSGDGILKGLEEADKLGLPRRGYVEMTSIDPKISLELNEAIAMKQGMYLEASLHGTSKDAEEGTLLIVASGDRRVFNECESCFHAFGKHAFYLTCEVGYSAKMTIILNTFIATMHVVIAEALVLVEKLNMSKDFFLKLLSFWLVNVERVLNIVEKVNDLNLSLPFKEILKDINYSLLWANKFSQPMRVTAVANERIKLLKHRKQIVNNSTECTKDLL